VSDVQEQVVAVLGEVLNLQRTAGFTPRTQLLGAIPELDSMSVVSVLTTLEERFGIEVFDDEIDGATFATVGSLTQFVEQKLAAQSA
jgi:acyl carrier protein